MPARSFAGPWLRAAMLVLVMISVMPAFAGNARSADGGPAESERVRIEWGLRIPMRDGINLAATLYRPAGQDGPGPVIIGMTPYTSDSYHFFGMYYARRGYGFVAINVRGRGGSQGEFNPLVHDSLDGYDAIEWIAKQPWSNGKVAMSGGSYSGSNQWATAKEFPAHLTTTVPIASAFPGVDFPPVNGIFRSYNIQWLVYTGGAASNSQAFRDMTFWINNYRDLYQGKVAFKDFDKHVGKPSKIFQTWVEHPHPDAYYDAMTPSDEEFRRLDLPILTITGHHDANQPGAMAFYRRHMRLGATQSIAKHYLLIGPWDHPGTRFPRQRVGGVDFGAASVIDITALSKQWYDWTMKDGPRPEFLKDRVTWYVAGAKQWKYASSLDEVTARTRDLFLDANGSRGRTAQDPGTLTVTEPAVAHTSHYVDTPLGAAEKIEREMAQSPKLDERLLYQGDVLALKGDGLVYDSEPFADPTEISGFVKLVLWLSMDVLDTDLRARLYEISTDGRSIMLTEDLMRARYRESTRREKLVTPGKVERYEFRNFAFFSRLIGKDSRLRLVIDGNDSIHWQQNFNSGGVVAEETAKDAITATVTLHQDRDHRSKLILPIGR